MGMGMGMDVGESRGQRVRGQRVWGQRVRRTESWWGWWMWHVELADAGGVAVAARGAKHANVAR